MKIHDWLQNLNNLFTDLDCRAESTWLLHFEQLHAPFPRVWESTSDEGWPSSKFALKGHLILSDPNPNCQHASI